MAYRILYVDNGDVVAEESTYETAFERLQSFLEEHPELDDEIGIQEINAEGVPVGDVAVGIEVAGQQLAL